jgi:hypothetical protein
MDTSIGSEAVSIEIPQPDLVPALFYICALNSVNLYPIGGRSLGNLANADRDSLINMSSVRLIDVDINICPRIPVHPHHHNSIGLVCRSRAGPRDAGLDQGLDPGLETSDEASRVIVEDSCVQGVIAVDRQGRVACDLGRQLGRDPFVYEVVAVADVGVGVAEGHACGCRGQENH